MVSGKYSALSGAIARQQSIANTSANLAHVSTAGYKKKRISFEAIFKGEQQIAAGKGVNYNRIRGNYSDFSQGPLKETGNPFDIAINGEGFFKIRSSEGDLLTRKGNFILGDDGRLLTDSGLPVLSSGGAEIFIPQEDSTNIAFDKEGNISTINESGESTIVGQLAIVNVENTDTLQEVKDTAYALPQDGLEIPAENFNVVQGSIEGSNVNMTEEMSKMLADNRLYEAYHNILKSYGKLGEKLSELGSIG
ncbi:MAG: flagellar basal-body rod protein FlgF [Desulfocapsaceae bacterium]|nr:flagellar basal-body rod protein FlgF [Desulfocapsaceae bacterium]